MYYEDESQSFSVCCLVRMYDRVEGEIKNSWLIVLPVKQKQDIGLAFPSLSA